MVITNELTIATSLHIKKVNHFCYGITSLTGVFNSPCHSECGGRRVGSVFVIMMLKNKYYLFTRKVFEFKVISVFCK